ncbi:MAG: LysR family transcriptional regulator [Gammaproteobacteria bacterium]|nr:LysR family transcriptional regulator [Gammaproteobacteria bacterium]
MNQLDLVEALIAVADCGSVQKAATQLHQTTSAISRKITKLEASLGVQLLKRHRAGTVLTEVGQRYYYECKQALLQFKKAEQLATAAVDHPSGKLRVVSNQYYAKHWLMPKLPSFLQRYPDIELHLDIQEIQPNFEKNKMDILFGVHTQGSDDLVRKRFDHYRRILCASPEYLQKHGCPKCPSELLQHQFIVHDARLQQNSIVMDDNEPVLTKPFLFINQSQIILEAALNNLGIVWVVETMAAPWLDNGQLVEIMKSKNQRYVDVYLYYRYQKHTDTKIAVFVEHFSKS